MRSSDEYDSAPSRKYSRTLLDVFACIGYNKFLFKFKINFHSLWISFFFQGKWNEFTIQAAKNHWFSKWSWPCLYQYSRENWKFNYYVKQNEHQITIFLSWGNCFSHMLSFWYLKLKSFSSFWKLLLFSIFKNQFPCRDTWKRYWLHGFSLFERAPYMATKSLCNGNFKRMSTTLSLLQLISSIN